MPTLDAERLIAMFAEKPEVRSRHDLLLAGRLIAGVKFLPRTGARDLEVRWKEKPVEWHVSAIWGAQRVESQGFCYPAPAMDDLLTTVVNGGKCARCQRTTIMNVIAHGYCSIVLTCADVDDPGNAYFYVRDCEALAGFDKPPTTVDQLPEEP